MKITVILNAFIEKDEFGYFAQIPELKGCAKERGQVSHSNMLTGLHASKNGAG